MSDDNIPGLRHLFGEAPHPRIDVAAVTQRSRARRLPKVLGIGVAGALAIGGVSVIGVQYALVDQGTVTALSLQDSSDSGAAPEAAAGSDSATGLQSMYDEAKRSAASQLNRCDAPVLEMMPSRTGLTLGVSFSDAAAGSASIDGIVTLTNDGQEAIVGYTASQPTIVLSQSGTVLWHTNGEPTGPDITVDLAPGQSMSYSAAFTPVRCSIDDEQTTVFRDDLPALPAGTYQVSAVIDVFGDFDADLVMSAPRTVTLH